jgi:hypothetical protein
MNVKKKLLEVARVCSQAASMKLRADAQTLLKVSEQLDDTSAAIYLERFCQKWGLDERGWLNAMPVSQVRRAPTRTAEPALRPAPLGAEAVMLGEVMIDELEAHILAELGAQPPRVEIEVCFEGLDEDAGWAR